MNQQKSDPTGAVLSHMLSHPRNWDSGYESQILSFQFRVNLRATLPWTLLPRSRFHFFYLQFVYHLLDIGYRRCQLFELIPPFDAVNITR